MIEAAEVLSIFPELWLQRRVMRLATLPRVLENGIVSGGLGECPLHG
jgi:hypothetical protein